MTRSGARRNNVFLANRHFWQTLPANYRSAQLTGWRPALKEFVLRTMRRIPGLAPAEPQGFEYTVSFEVDLEAPNCIRQLVEAETSKPVVMV